MAHSPKNMVLLQDLHKVDGSALDQYFPLIYNEMKWLASNYLNGEYKQVTLRTTDLVHEAYLKLAGDAGLSWENKAHFFGIAARSMRQILVDLARKRNAQKRGGDQLRVSLSEGLMVLDNQDDKMLDLDVALNKLEGFDERLNRIVELRYFSGMTIEEVAVAIELSPATIKREWKLAKAWLFRELKGQGPTAAA